MNMYEGPVRRPAEWYRPFLEDADRLKRALGYLEHGRRLPFTRAVDGLTFGSLVVWDKTIGHHGLSRAPGRLAIVEEPDRDPGFYKRKPGAVHLCRLRNRIRGRADDRN